MAFETYWIGRKLEGVKQDMSCGLLRKRGARNLIAYVLTVVFILLTEPLNRRKGVMYHG